MRTVDEPESPDFSPDGKTIVLLGAAGRHRRHLRRSISRREGLTNLTKDDFADYAPDLRRPTASRSSTWPASAATRSCSSSISPPAPRRSSPSARTTTRRRSSSTPTRWSFSSTATDPAKPIDPEVARNGNIYNIWTLNLKTGELRQYTDTLTRQHVAVVLKDGSQQPQIAFVTYYKGEYGLHTLDRRRSRSPPSPRATSARPGRSSTSRRR